MDPVCSALLWNGAAKKQVKRHTKIHLSSAEVGPTLSGDVIGHTGVVL